jgi:hypothetical protein
MAEETEYVCALSGKSAPESALVDDGGEDNLGALPVGWLEVTIRRREPNPAWETLARRKARLTESTWLGIAGQLPEDLADTDKAEVRADVEASFDVQFAYAFSQIERYNVEEIVVHVAANDAQVKAEWDKIAESLGLSDE